MINRILDFAEQPARLCVRSLQLVVQRSEQPDVSVPLADVAVVVVAHPEVTYTQAVLSGLAEAGGAFVACNRKNLPVGMFLSLVGHSTQAERFAAQALASLPLRKRLWQRLVQAKVRAQSLALEDLHGTDHGLRAMAARVRSGDPENVEAQAARRYWPNLFADLAFRRDRDNEDQNLLLNYGYAVLRAIVARAICGAGLHPCLGLHHHNRYNPYCLADDLMEPFRPIVDRFVAQYCSEHDLAYGLDASAKRHIIAGLTGRFDFQGEQRTLFDIAARVATSLAEVFLGGVKELLLPLA